jgi:Zn-dependent peptidase ImmA (M78 family)/transcriptional regulator with XRE-family HTH domain
MARDDQSAAQPARVIPERIREAREARGFTAEKFAELLDVSRQAVGQYEVGQSVPSAPVMSRIIALTEQPPGFFTDFRNRSREHFGSAFWRSLKRMQRPDRLRIARRMEWAWDVLIYLEHFLDLPKLNLPSIEWDWETGSEDKLEKIAAQVRDHWSLGRGPIFHMAAVLENNGIILVKEPVNCEDMDAVSRWQGGRPFILVSADRDVLPRLNFDLAHELAHILLHQGVDVIDENLAKLERQANYFAGAFLLPREMFAREVVSTSIHYFLKLKERWRVSVAAMVYRCKELDILTPRQVTYLWRQLSAKGMRREEPLDRAFKTESPTILRTGLNMLVENRVQSRAEIRDALNLNPKDLESICGVPSGFLDEKVVALRFKTM